MYFNDFTPGQRFRAGSHTITEAEIIAFAMDYDPQLFHTNPEAAAKSIYGGLIASGFQTALIAFRMVVDANIWTQSSQGSPGIENLRWFKPVRPGDRLDVVLEVVDTRPSSRRDDRGYVTWDYIVSNQHDETVCQWRSTIITLVAPPTD